MSRRAALVAAAIVLAAVAAACGGGLDLSYIGMASASASVMVSDSMQVKADNTSFATITVEVRDNNQNPLHTGGDDVALATTRGTLSPVVDKNTGIYTATLKSSQTGPAVVTGSVNGQRITTGDITVTFVAP